MHAYARWPNDISSIITHKIGNTDPNSSTCEFPSLKASHQTIPQWYLSLGPMGSLLAACADPVVLADVRKLRVYAYMALVISIILYFYLEG